MSSDDPEDKWWRGPWAEGASWRLRRARYPLFVAFVLTLVLGLRAGMPFVAFGGFVLVLLAALVPARSRVERLAARHRNRGGADEVAAAQRAVLAAIAEPAFLLDDTCAVVEANAAASALFGPVARGAHLSARIRSPGVLDMVREAVAERRTGTIEHSDRVPSERWYQVHIAPLDEAAEDAGRFLLTFQDITEARRMDRMRSDFVANASHELRTPLASMTGFIETLQGPAKEDTAARERFLAIMLEQAERMGRLVEDLMSLSRLELRAHVAPSDRIALVGLIEHVCDALRPQAEELGVALAFTPASEEAVVLGDRDELIQVFQNLVENACKYGQSGERVEVSIAGPADGSDTPEGMVDVAVRDYGPGIPAEHVPRLTERFYRVDVETSRAKKGTGLGLAIVKHILTRHRARLIVRSRLGEGSVFLVRFKRA
ncbi:ATP-binding protein [Pararhizobium mangrovi]|uniref:histidine kinase n=1 Tax=Pararhizobium mangrovi TaxID=2590452 RepID=A0A506U263_9HYPH|nr:ATP-binding protein [Pararhizobium mangrovi]TPW25957.1 two-component sensor histidine kinase [Pararhizobium mangrovi]